MRATAARAAEEGASSAAGRAITVKDLPGGRTRVIRHATGIPSLVVKG